ncbi:adenine phosphoribosyltransferase [Myxococcota bacterium]|nr:adenine phosphoribosyltransferase [Myxococcota bacterium]MCZ7619261.1 adenine phosphoribosyltransferase [Myxococcota bacterium]
MPRSSVSRAPDLQSFIRDVPDFPRPGILFRDVTPLLGDAGALKAAVGALADPFRHVGVEKVMGIESRGFVFGAPVALALETGFALVRKAGKLPGRTRRVTYDLEYGTDTVEMHEDSLRAGERVLVVDDLIATGGTAAAAVQLARDCGAHVVGCAFLIELTALAGRRRLDVDPIHVLLRY